MSHEYSNDEITVSFDIEVCKHAAKCVGGLGAVFNPKEKPWINMQAAATGDIKRTIDTCPSGALKYRNKES